MNKRLKELAEQAGFEEQTHFIDSWECGLKEMERFAELVRQDYLRELKALKPVAWCVERKVATCNEKYAELWRSNGEGVTPLYALEETK